MSTSQNCCCQFLCPHSEPQLSPASARDPPILVGSLAQSLMGSLLFPLGPGEQKTLCVPSKSGVSISPIPVEVLQSNPAGLQSWTFWGLLLLLLDPQAGKPNSGLRTFTQWENFCGIIAFQSVGCPPSGYGI